MTPTIPIITPITLLIVNFSLGIKRADKTIAAIEVFAFKIDASPPVVDCWPDVINKKGIKLLNNPMIKYD